MSFYIALAVYILISIAVLFGVYKILQKVIQKYDLIPDVYRLHTYLLTVPKNEIATEKGAEQNSSPKEKLAHVEMLFATLGGVKAQRDWKSKIYGRKDHFALEIIADREGLVSFYATIPGYLKAFFEQQLLAQYSEANMEKVEDYNIFNPKGITHGATLSFRKPYIFPIKTYQKTETDPLSGLTNVLSKITKEEGAAIQIIARSAHPRWHKWGSKVASTMQQGKTLKVAMREANKGIIGKIFGAGSTKKSGANPSPNEPYRLSPMEEEVVKGLEEKTNKAGFEVNIRLIVSSPTKDMAENKLRNLVDSFSQFSGYEYNNAFQARFKKESSKLIRKFIYREFDEKNQMILNSEEMASVWHLPDNTTDTPNIRWLMAKKAPPPTNLPNDGTIIGNINFRNQETVVRIKREDRRRHMYIIGKSGSGKSVLQSSMIIQDIQNGEGVCVVDPHGDLVNDVLPHIPKERADDVIIFDPSDVERPPGLNMLEYATEDERDFAVQEIMAIFMKLFDAQTMGPIFEHYMRNAMLCLMADKEAGATIIEIPRLFTDDEFRKKRVAKVTDPVVKAFWEQEYEQSQKGQAAGDMKSYIISKLGRFLTNDMMRNIVGQKKSSFDFQDVMNNRKILLVNLAKGKIGEINSNLLGLIIVAKIQMAAFKRAEMDKEFRKDFYLYIDEFQNFVTDSIAVILSEARKYMLNLIIAHQYIGQISKKDDSTIKDAVFGNVGSMIAYRVGPEDAQFLVNEFAPTFGENDLINAEKYTANVKLLIDNTASRPFNMKGIYPPQGNLKTADAIRRISRIVNGRERKIVQEEIRERSKFDQITIPAEEK